jgi:hypothetical protein
MKECEGEQVLHYNESFTCLLCGNEAFINAKSYKECAKDTAFQGKIPKTPPTVTYSYRTFAILQKKIISAPCSPVP